MLRVETRVSIQAIFRRSTDGILHVNEQPVDMDGVRCSGCSNRDYKDCAASRPPQTNVIEWVRDLVVHPTIEPCCGLFFLL